MKRFMLVPTIILGSVLLTTCYFAVAHAQSSLQIPNIPVPAAELMPGQQLPSDVHCLSYAPDYNHRFCTQDDVWLTIKGARISKAAIFTYRSGLRLGDLMTAWGEPIGADYGERDAVAIYWPDRYAFVVEAKNFGPYSRIGYIVYGKPDPTFTVWRGYLSSAGR
jgi:hypothetical protein